MRLTWGLVILRTEKKINITKIDNKEKFPRAEKTFPFLWKSQSCLKSLYRF